MAKNQSQISTIDDEPEVAQAAPAAVVVAAENHDSNLSGVMEMVTIHSSSEENGGDAVLLIHNGFARQVPRDKPVALPTEVAQILRDAKTTQYRPGPGGAIVEEFRPRYAFSATPIAA